MHTATSCKKFLKFKTTAVFSPPFYTSPLFPSPLSLCSPPTFCLLTLRLFPASPLPHKLQSEGPMFDSQFRRLRSLWEKMSYTSISVSSREMAKYLQAVGSVMHITRRNTVKRINGRRKITETLLQWRLPSKSERPLLLSNRLSYNDL